MAVNLSSATRAFITSHRVARLATVDAAGTPHLVPICYVYDGRHIYSAVDLKPKRTAARELKRVRNIRSDPRVAVLIDDYSEDWADLAYVLVQGTAVVMESGEERAAAEAVLRDKYEQYRDLLEDGCLVVRVTPENVVAWGRLERTGQDSESYMSRQTEETGAQEPMQHGP